MLVHQLRQPVWREPDLGRKVTNADTGVTESAPDLGTDLIDTRVAARFGIRLGHTPGTEGLVANAKELIAANLAGRIR